MSGPLQCWLRLHGRCLLPPSPFLFFSSNFFFEKKKVNKQINTNSKKKKKKKKKKKGNQGPQHTNYYGRALCIVLWVLM